MKFLAAAALSVALLGCMRGPSEDESVESLMQTSRDWSKVAQSGDMARVAEYFADDAVMISPGEAPVRGKTAIRAHLDEARKIPGFSIRWEPLEGKVSGNMGYLLERTHLTVTGPEGTPVTNTMNAVTVWRREAGKKWKNVVDASIPAPSTAAQR